MAAKTTRKRHRNHSNLELAKAMHGLGSSNAALPHVREDRKGGRRDNKRKAIADASY